MYVYFFAAGADIKEMQPMHFPQVYKENFLCHWANFAKARTPIIAAVNGYAVRFLLVETPCRNVVSKLK